MRRLVLAAFFVTSAAIISAAGLACAQTPDATGLWSGTTRVTPPCSFSSGRCNAVNNVTFTLRLKGNRLKGKFTCAYGNLICRNGGADSTGKVVSGRISGSEIRLSVVISADVSNCYYNGQLISANAMRGTYMCYQGGELVEEGMWDVKRGSAG